MDKDFIEQTIQAIKSELPNFHAKPESLGKFKDSAEDKEYLSYVNGNGGFYCLFLDLLAQKLKFKNIVELGNREGLSTLCIYDGLPEGTHFTTIDIDRDQRYCPPQMFTDPRVSFIFGDVSDLNIFKEIPIDIDFLFMDTIHYYFQLKDEWAVYEPLLSDTAIVAIDDINLNDCRKFFDDMPYAKWDLTELCHASGWGLFLYQRQSGLTKQQRLTQSLKASVAIWHRKALELETQTTNLPKNRFKKNAKDFLHNHPLLHKTSLVIRGKGLKSK